MYILKIQLQLILDKSELCIWKIYYLYVITNNCILITIFSDNNIKIFSFKIFKYTDAEDVI